MFDKSIDTRAVHVKLATIAGRTHFVTVLPTVIPPDNDLVWVKRKSHASVNEPMVYDGLGALQDYAMTYADQHA